jgi:hypothetical protein
MIIKLRRRKRVAHSASIRGIKYFSHDFEQQTWSEEAIPTTDGQKKG